MILLEQIEKELHNLPPEKQTAVLDFILFLQTRSVNPSADHMDKQAEHRTERIRLAFQELAELKGLASIQDPIAWQKEIRQDRLLPGRAS